MFYSIILSKSVNSFLKLAQYFFTHLKSSFLSRHVPLLILFSVSSYAGNILHNATTYNKTEFPVFYNPLMPIATDLTTNPARFNVPTSVLPGLPAPSTLSVPSTLSAASTPSRFVSTMQNFNNWKPQSSKQYVCSKCGKSLSHIFTLKRHRNTVCGKKRNTKGEFECKYCEKRYDSAGSLSRHYRFECGVPPQFHCVFCDRMFTQRCSLLRHLKKFHPEQGVPIRQRQRQQTSEHDRLMTDRLMHDSELKISSDPKIFSPSQCSTIWTNPKSVSK